MLYTFYLFALVYHIFVISDHYIKLKRDPYKWNRYLYNIWNNNLIFIPPIYNLVVNTLFDKRVPFEFFPWLYNEWRPYSMVDGLSPAGILTIASLMYMFQFHPRFKNLQIVSNIDFFQIQKFLSLGWPFTGKIATIRNSFGLLMMMCLGLCYLYRNSPTMIK